MSLSPGNKSGNSFNFYLQNSVTLWKPSLREIMALLKVWYDLGLNRKNIFFEPVRENE